MKELKSDNDQKDMPDDDNYQWRDDNLLDRYARQKLFNDYDEKQADANEVKQSFNIVFGINSRFLHSLQAHRTNKETIENVGQSIGKGLEKNNSTSA